jgi:hypothetical protein
VNSWLILGRAAAQVLALARSWVLLSTAVVMSAGPITALPLLVSARFQLVGQRRVGRSPSA